MQKIEFIKRLLLLIALLNLVGCQALRSPSERKPASQISNVSQTEEEDVSLDWFTSSQLEPTDTVSTSEAKAFINNVYQILDAEIFDPAFKKEERSQQLQELLATADTQPNWSRAEIIKRVSNELQKLSMSHLRILDPVEGERLFRIFEQKPLPNETSEPAISAEVRGTIGILRVESFIIPRITKAELDRAKTQLAQAKVILIDVRRNEGGYGSSVSYLAEDIIGPNKVLWRDRSRKGLAMQEPYIFQGYFDDAINLEAEAEIELSEQHPYIEWQTRPDAQVDPRPHFVLIDDKCGSACDLFAAVIKDHGAAQLLGVRTMGALLGGDAFKLNWSGYALIAPVLQVVSPKGHTIEGVGVPPDIEIPECANGGSQCLDKALEIVNAAG